MVILVKKDWLVNIPRLGQGVLRPLLELPLESKGKDFYFCIPRDRWDKEFYQLQGG